MKDEKIVLDTSDEAAKFVTGISGWVSRDGHFCGNDEHIARYIGSTHKLCECGNIVEKMWLKCGACRAKEAQERFNSFPNKEWDGNSPIALFDGEEFFFDYSALSDYCEDHDTSPEKLMLVHCRPNYAREIDPNELYCDELPEDGEVDGNLAEEFEKLNRYIRENKIVLSWSHDDVAVIINPDEVKED